MPNWAEGTLKIRGKKENVIRFLKEGIIASPNFKMTEDGPVTVPQKVEIIEGETTKNIVKKYDDYFWEVPFSTIGG